MRVEVLALLGWVVLGVRGDVATTDFLDGDVLDVEANVVTGESLGKRLVVHLHRFDLESKSKSQSHQRGARNQPPIESFTISGDPEVIPQRQ